MSIAALGRNAVRRRLVLLPVCLVASLTALPAVAAVDGVVRNGTTNAPQAGVQVSVVQPGQNGMQSLGNATSAGDGAFAVDVTPNGVALLQSTYQGVTYTQALPPGTPTTGVEVLVYESTDQPPPELSTEHLILLEPGIDMLTVSETFFIRNESKVTYQDSANGTLRLYLPEGAADGLQATVNSVGVPIQRPVIPAGEAGLYKIDYPAKPGETRFDLTYTSANVESYTGRVVSNDPPTRIVVPSTVMLSGEGLSELGVEPTTQARIYTFTGNQFEVAIQGIGAIRSDALGGEDAGQPQCCEEAPPRVNTQLPWVLGLAFGILALGGVLLYRRGAA